MNPFAYATNAHANARLYQSASRGEARIARDMRDAGHWYAWTYHSDAARMYASKARNELWNLIGEPEE